jgi:hypothetical protein
VLKKAAFRLNRKSGQFLRAHRNGQVPHHGASTCEGVCGQEYSLRMLTVRLSKSQCICRLSVAVSIRHTSKNKVNFAVSAIRTAFTFLTGCEARNVILKLRHKVTRYPVYIHIYIYIYTVELHLSGRWLSGSPIIRIGLALRGKFVENSKKLTCLEITGYQTKYSTVLWLLELQNSHGRKV